MWRMSFCYYAFLYLLAAEFLRHRVINCFSAVERQNLHGIWKLQLDPANALNTKDGKNILLKIQEDGSFQQCNDDDRPDDKNWMTGLWAFEDQELKLAMDRKCFSRDVLLSGKVCEGTESGCKFSIQKGVVSAGRFMYPQAHTSFFENPMAAAERAGKFSLKQVFGFSSIPISTEREEKPANKFKTSDFYNRKFFMTFVPIESKGKSRKEVHDELPVDIRAMPIEFLPNGTFVATGTNKILRGRFEITEENMLRFKVSRFGIGRSTPGSVYSEGKGLSHEDERTYLGEIDEVGKGQDKVVYRVNGTVTFGADLGTDARPEPVGEFLLTELGQEAQSSIMLDMPDEDEDLFDSVFE